MKNKNKTVRTSRPTGEMINSFKEITNFVHKSQSEKNKNINNMLNRKQKIKMPLKMYMGIKKAVLKKHEKEKSHNQINAIIGETHKKEKLMTHVILNKLEEKNDLKKNRKLFISRNKSKSRFQDGTLNLNKNFMKNINKSGNNNIRK